jgi:predicted MFS family arabinose efflux permease
MTLRQRKTSYFVLEGMNAFATTYYFFYLFFHMERHFGFGNLQNLSLAAGNGLLYMVGSLWGGRCGQRWGCAQALRVGFTVMALALGSGIWISSATGQVLVMVVWTVGMCFTWPNLEAAVSHIDDPARLPRMIGIYNLVWAGVGALAFFVGGALIERLGSRSLFWVPATIHVTQLVWLSVSHWTNPTPQAAAEASPGAPTQSATVHRPPDRLTARRFLHLAWMANPFAYVAMNTMIAVTPSIAQSLQLTQTMAGFYCSVWFFTRFLTFLGLWLWPAWHYRFDWFLASFLVLIVSLAAILLVPSLAVLILAQIGLGWAVGLIYYSSLYYSMDASDAKAQHGGFHEAAIGLGVFLGPAVGASSLHLFPHYPSSGAWAVCGLLMLGLSGLLWRYRRS